MNVEVLQESEKGAWDEYVHKTKQATFFHLIGWREVIKKTYGHKDLYLVAKEGKDIQGILPLFCIEHFLLGKHLVSLPFCSYGGVAAKNDTARDALLQFLRDYAEKYRIKDFELRNLDKVPDLVTDVRYATFIVQLRKEDELWNLIDKKARNQVRKAKTYKLQLENSSALLSRFYALYTKRMHMLGTPPHSFAFFTNLIDEFRDNCQVLMATFEGKDIASSFLFTFGDGVHNLWAVWNDEYREQCPNNFLYWETLRLAIEQGYAYVDLGRSPRDSQVASFKKQWAPEEKQLYYQTSGNHGGVSQGQGYASRVWRRIPYAITKTVGPKLRKYVY